jgi:hypothetical protein
MKWRAARALVLSFFQAQYSIRVLFLSYLGAHCATAFGSSRIAREIFALLRHHDFAVRTSIKITSELPCNWFACWMEMRGTLNEAAPAAVQLRAEAAEREIKKALMAKRVRMFMVEPFNGGGVK